MLLYSHQLHREVGIPYGHPLLGHYSKWSCYMVMLSLAMLLSTATDHPSSPLITSPYSCDVDVNLQHGVWYAGTH